MGDSAYWRNFCMRSPRPALVRVLSAEGSNDIQIEPEQNWARLGDTIDALDPDRVELYTENEVLLRAEKRKVPRNEQYVRMPDGLHKDPEAARLMHFADLLHRAYAHSTEVAFNRIVDIVSMQQETNRELAQRAEKAERDKLRYLQELITLRGGAVAGEGEGGGLESLLQAFMGGMAQGKSVASSEPEKESE